MKTRKIGLESPISFADLLEESQEPSILNPSRPDLESDDTETNEQEDTVNDNEEENGDEDEEMEEEEEESVTDPVSLSVTTTKNLLQVSDIDESFLERTMDAFCNNLKQSVQEQFVSSRERLFRQTENEINGITKVYQKTVNNKESELEQMRMEKEQLNQKYNDLNMKHCKLQTAHSETKKKLACVRQLSQTVMKWKNDCDKKRFVANFVSNTIIPNKNKIKMQNIYYFWKNKALTKHYTQYDEMWQKRLETVSKKIIEQYEISINQLRDELNTKTYELQQLQSERNTQQQDMKRAFMRGVSALNLEAMSLFSQSQKENNSNISNKKMTQEDEK